MLTIIACLDMLPRSLRRGLNFIVYLNFNISLLYFYSTVLNPNVIVNIQTVNLLLLKIDVRTIRRTFHEALFTFLYTV